MGRAEEVRAKDAVCNNQHNPGSIVLPKDASCGKRLLLAHSDALQLLPLYDALNGSCAPGQVVLAPTNSMLMVEVLVDRMASLQVTNNEQHDPHSASSS